MADKPEDVIQRLRNKLGKAIEDSTSKKATQGVADYAANMVRVRTRLGYGVENGNKVRLKPLKDSYKKQRAGKLSFFTIGTGSERTIVPYKPLKKPNLHQDTTPNRSNLTFSGQMIDSVYGMVEGIGRFSLLLRGKRNNDVSGYVEEQGRPWFHFSRAEMSQIIGQFRNQLLQFLRKAGLG